MSMQERAKRHRHQLAEKRRNDRLRAGRNDRYSGPIYRGTNINQYEAAEIDRLIERELEIEERGNEMVLPERARRDHR